MGGSWLLIYDLVVKGDTGLSSVFFELITHNYNFQVQGFSTHKQINED
ncbi:MAG: hypothetical protein TRG1_1604 [Flavobacteriaceae bacterium FS1-H7996/R]|nr:MAG: hypothetical protein TRG1_1604 [Flavobacteriaceae bacterium FS1-H7996/R]